MTPGSAIDRRDVARAAARRAPRPTARVSVSTRLDAVLERRRTTVSRADQRRQQRERRRGVVQLDGEEHDVGRADRGRIARAALTLRQMNIAFRAVDAQPAVRIASRCAPRARK